MPGVGPYTVQCYSYISCTRVLLKLIITHYNMDTPPVHVVNML